MSFEVKTLPKPYSRDLRARVIDEITTGASRREAAERYGISAREATSPLEDHAEFLLALIAERSDLTLDEIVLAMEKRRIAGSRSAVWRFFDRRNISFKKNFIRGRAKARRRGPRAQTLDARAGYV